MPPLAAVFKTAVLTGGEWLAVAALSLAPIAVVELEKAAEERARRKHKEREQRDRRREKACRN